MCKGLIFVDAGIGRPSDACRIMELGFDGVLLNLLWLDLTTQSIWLRLSLAVKVEEKSFIWGNKKN